MVFCTSSKPKQTFRCSQAHLSPINKQVTIENFEIIKEQKSLSDNVFYTCSNHTFSRLHCNGPVNFTGLSQFP